MKIKEAMTKVFEELTAAAAIDNRLTGTFKEAHEEREAAYQGGMDANVKLMGGQSAGGSRPAPQAAPTAAARPSVTPAGVSPEVAEGAKKLLSQPIAPRSN